MLKTLLLPVALLALAFTARAESTAKISGVHLCCKSCVTGVNKAVGKVDGATAEVNADDETVTVKAADDATAQKAVDALVAAGYFGKSDNSAIKVADNTGATDAKVASMVVNDVHLCCGKCVTTVAKAVEKVPGVASHTAVKGVKTFEVKGDFSPKAVFAAIQAAGLTGKVGK
jgi:periplasmic mercuric ion binding protein